MLDAFRFSLAISGHNDGLSSVIGKGMPTLARSRTEGKIIAKLTSEKEGDGTAAFGRSFGSWAKLRMELLRATTGFSVGFTQFTATVRALRVGCS